MDPSGPRPEAPGWPVLAFLSAVRLVLNTGFRFVYPFLPAISRGLGIPFTQVGVLVSARWVAGLTTPAVIRALGRGERRLRLIVAGLVLYALGAAVTAAAGVFVGALAGFALLGLAKPVYDVAAQAYLSDRTPYRRRARYLAVIELTWAGSLLVGAPAAGWLIGRFGWTAPFWTLAVLCVGALVAVGWALEPDRPPMVGGHPTLALDPSALALLGAAALFSGGAEVMFVVFGAWLEDGFGLSLLALGAAGTVVAVSELAGEGATLAWTDRVGKRRSVAIGLVVSTAGYLLLVVTQGDLTAGLASVALALAGFEFTIVSTFPLASEARPLARTRFLAVLVVATGVGRAVGASVGPVLFEAAGLTANALAASAANLLALGLLGRWVREAPVGG